MRRPIPHLGAELLFNRPWPITQTGLRELVSDFEARLRSATTDEGDDDDDNLFDVPVTNDGIACIPVFGPLTRSRYGFGTSYSDLTRMCSGAMAADKVNAVLLCFDSPGGEAGGMFECSDFLYRARSIKPIVALSADSCYSAAYCLASAADRIFTTTMGGTGSIGCWTAHVDMSKMLDQAGIKVTYVFAGKKKVDGNPYEPLLDRAKADMQTECDRVRALFVQAVARNRGVAADALYATEAGIFMAEAGVPLLADAVGGMDAALSYLRTRIAASPSPRAGSTSAARVTSATTAAPPQSGGGWEAVKKLQAAGYLVLGGQQFGAQRGSYASRGSAPQFRSSGGAASTQEALALRGTAVPYGVPSTPNRAGECDEFARGCFSRCLAARPDLRVLFNFDPAFVLGRVPAGTARVWEDSDGLEFAVDPPDAQWAKDLLVSVSRGDIRGSAAACRPVSTHVEQRGGNTIRVIDQADLYLVSVASFRGFDGALAIEPK